MSEVRTEIELDNQPNFNITYDGGYGKDGFCLSLDSNVSIGGHNRELENLAVEILIFLSNHERLASCLQMVFSNIDLDKLYDTIDKLVEMKEEHIKCQVYSN